MSNPPESGRNGTYHPDPTAPDNRLLSPAYERNMPPLRTALTPLLSGREGVVLEIGAGSGQHASAFTQMFPNLDWWPSDPDPAHRASISAWAAHFGLPSRKPIDLDASSDWSDLPEIRAVRPLTAILSINVIHIAPIAVVRGIVAGAAKSLAPRGVLIFYGPFKIDGQHIGDGNARFDRELRTSNPEWGIRDVADIQKLGRAAKLSLHSLHEMPSNNRLLVLAKP